MTPAVIILMLVLLAIMLRQWIPKQPPIWLIMLLGGIAALLTGSISIKNALQSIDMNVMLYLFGVFALSQALEDSGYLEELGFHAFAHTKTAFHLLFFIILVCGLGSALLMNDTMAIVGIPVLLTIAKRNNLILTPFALALAYSISIGSVMSPIGNPQNLLIAIQGNLSTPFIQFAKHLLIPTLINLVIAYLFIALRFRKTLQRQIIQHTYIPHRNKHLTLLCKIGLLIMLTLIVLKIVLIYLHLDWELPFSIIALGAAAPILLFSQQRFSVLKKMDWGTLLFFIGLFILMRAVWDAGFFQHILKTQRVDVHHTSTILIISALFSQLISNVPLVALYLPLLHHSANTTQLLALAAGSTIAGNFFIIGAASNIIILQNAEKRGAHAFSFWGFAALGIPLGVANLLVYFWFLT